MRTKFIINGAVFPYTKLPGEMYCDIIGMLDFKYWSHDALVNFFNGTLEMLNIYCDEVLEENKIHKNIHKDYLNKIKGFKRRVRNLFARKYPEEIKDMIKMIYAVALNFSELKMGK